MAIYFVIFFCFFCIKKSELVAFFFGGYLPTAPSISVYSFHKKFLLKKCCLVVYLHAIGQDCHIMLIIHLYVIYLGNYVFVLKFIQNQPYPWTHSAFIGKIKPESGFRAGSIFRSECFGRSRGYRYIHV